MSIILHNNYRVYSKASFPKHFSAVSVGKLRLNYHTCIEKLANTIVIKMTKIRHKMKTLAFWSL